MTETDLHATVAEFLDWALMAPALYTTFPAGWGALPKATAGRLKGCGLKKGMPDIFVFYKSRAIGIELKTDAGKVSVEQQCMFHLLKEAGVPVHVCRSLEEVAYNLREEHVPLKMRFTDFGVVTWQDDEQRARKKWRHVVTSAKRAADGATAEAGDADGAEEIPAGPLAAETG